jgi:hypothetical protein
LTDICHPLIEQNGHPNSRNSSNAHGLPGMKTGLSLFETRQEDTEKKNLPTIFAPIARGLDCGISSLLVVVCHCHCAHNKSHCLEAQLAFIFSPS